MKKLFLFVLLLSAMLIHCGPTKDKPVPPSVVGTPQPSQGGIFYWPLVTKSVDGYNVTPPENYIVRCVSGGTIKERSVYGEVVGNEFLVDMTKFLPMDINATWECFAKASSSNRDGVWSSEGVQFTVENYVIK